MAGTAVNHDAQIVVVGLISFLFFAAIGIVIGVRWFK